MNFTKAMIELQARIHQQTGKRTDVYYCQGYGALIVYEGAELTPANVIYAATEMELAVLNF